MRSIELTIRAEIDDDEVYNKILNEFVEDGDPDEFLQDGVTSVKMTVTGYEDDIEIIKKEL